MEREHARGEVRHVSVAFGVSYASTLVSRWVPNVGASCRSAGRTMGRGQMTVIIRGQDMKAKNRGKSTLIDESLRVLRSAFAGIALLGLPINLLMLTGPLFILQVYDRVLGSGSVPTLVVLAGMTIGLYVFYGLLEGIRARVLLRIGQRLDAQLSGASYECSVGLPIRLGAKAERLDPVRDL